MKDQCMSVNDVCSLLNLKKNFVYKLVNEGKVPHLRFEKRTRVPAAAAIQIHAAGHSCTAGIITVPHGLTASGRLLE